MVAPTLALVAAGVAAIAFDMTQRRNEPPREPSSLTVAPAGSPPSTTKRDQGLDAIETAQADISAVATALAGPPRLSDTGNEIVPTFDVARIEPSGEAVIAGRAAPGANVELLRNGEVHDRAVADRSGQFVMVPPRLPVGDYQLTLRSGQPDGRQAMSKQSVVVGLGPNLKDQSVVALLTPDGAGVVLSKPAPNPIVGAVAIDMVETEPDGKLHVSGRSSSGAAVRLYLNDNYRASTMAAADGHFAFTVAEGIGPGSHRARLDEVESGSGAVRSRAEVAFNVPATLAANHLDEAVGALHGEQHPQSDPQIAKQEDVGAGPDQQGPAAVPGKDKPSAVAVPKGATVVVSRGDSLWRISHAVYGTGLRYAVIFGANHHQIRNPNRIYPGQVFVLPEKAR